MSTAIALKEWREKSGLSVRAAAAAAGLKLSTYQRYEDPRRFKRPQLPMEIASALAEAAVARGADPAPVLELARVPEPTITGLSDVDVIRYDMASLTDRRDAAVATLLEGQPNWSPWLVRGRSLIRTGYLPGDIVVCDHCPRSPETGRVVVANIDRDIKAMTARTVLRLYDPPYLLAASDDPAYRRPIYVDGEHAVVMGYAVAMLRMM